MSRICVVGSGYVGLVTGTCFAELGNHVVCVDNDGEKVGSLRAGKVPFYEPGLSELMVRNQQVGRLSFTTSIAEGCAGAEFAFIAVGTPQGADGHADLQYVRAAARDIARSIDGPLIIVNKSTVPVETGDLVASIVREHKTSDHEVRVVSNPEFLREGSAVRDFMKPDRVVLGVSDPDVERTMRDLYSTLDDPQIIVTDVRTAEMIKYTANCFLATKISFMNEISQVCEVVGADILDVVAGVGSDRRIGHAFLNAGLGFGGSCFPKDLAAMAKIAEARGVVPRILQSVIDVNADQVGHVVQRMEFVLGDLHGKIIAVCGLSFKPDTDDIRDSQAIEIIRQFVAKGATVKAHDPVAQDVTRAATKDIKSSLTFHATPYDCANDADAFLLATEWPEYRNVDFAVLRKLMKGDLVVDGRNIYPPAKVTDFGLRYLGVGRPFRDMARPLEHAN
jgi:UDPglucose 6-dehydrogenase